MVNQLRRLSSSAGRDQVQHVFMMVDTTGSASDPSRPSRRNQAIP